MTQWELWKIRYTTYNLITVVQLQHHIRRIAGNSFGISVDFNMIEDESLIPCGIQSGPYDFCGLAQM